MAELTEVDKSNSGVFVRRVNKIFKVMHMVTPDGEIQKREKGDVEVRIRFRRVNFLERDFREREFSRDGQASYTARHRAVRARGPVVLLWKKKKVGTKAHSFLLKPPPEALCTEAPCCKFPCCCCRPCCQFCCTLNIQKNPVYANRDLSLAMGKGEVLGLLGANGAGKTTLFRMMCGVDVPSQHPDSEIFIGGNNLVTQRDECRKVIGYTAQANPIWNKLTVEEHLNFYATVKGVPDDRLKEIVNQTIVDMDLSLHLKKRAGNLSGGNKRKLVVAMSLIGAPPVLFLDEPSAGMDPEARRKMWSIIQRIATKQKHSTVVLTTHSMDECEALCSKVAIMTHGILRTIGTVPVLRFCAAPGIMIKANSTGRDWSSTSGPSRSRVEDEILPPVVRLDLLLVRKTSRKTVHPQSLVNRLCAFVRMKNVIPLPQIVVRPEESHPTWYPAIYPSRTTRSLDPKDGGVVRLDHLTPGAIPEIKANYGKGFVLHVRLLEGQEQHRKQIAAQLQLGPAYVGRGEDHSELLRTSSRRTVDVVLSRHLLHVVVQHSWVSSLCFTTGVRSSPTRLSDMNIFRRR